jgi:hypothetical protein
MKVELLTTQWHLRSANVPPLLVTAQGYRLAIFATMVDMENMWGRRPQTVLFESDGELAAVIAEAKAASPHAPETMPTDGELLRQYLDVRQVLVRLT